MRKQVFHKITIIFLCILCVYFPIKQQYDEVQAIAVVDDLAIAGMIGLLTLCGLTFTDAGKDSVRDVCTYAYDQLTAYAGTLADGAKEGVTALINGAVTSGTVALDAFNTWGNSIGRGLYDLVNGSTNSYTGDLELGNISDFITYDGFDLYKMGDLDSIGGVVGTVLATENVSNYDHYLLLVTAYRIYVGVCNNYVDSKGAVFEPYIDVYSGRIGFSSNGTTSSFVRLHEYRLDDGTRSNIGPYSLKLSDILFAGTTATVISTLGQSYKLGLDGKWTDPLDTTLELDPPWITNRGQTDKLKLLDGTNIDYGNINSLDIPRYVGRDAYLNPDGTTVYPGTYSVPLDSVRDYPLSIPGDITKDYPYTIPKDTVGDITTDTPITGTIEGTTDTPGDTVGDIPSVKVPGTLDWKEYFPFCVPFDLIKFIGVLAAEPETPKFTWSYNFVLTKGTFTLDLKDFNGVAGVCRTLMDLIFIVGLISITREKIKG